MMVRAVYGSREDSSMNLAAFGSAESLSSSSSGSDAVKAQKVPLGLWIMVEREGAAVQQGGNTSTAAAAAAGASSGDELSEACRTLLLLPTGGSSPGGPEQHLQQQPGTTAALIAGEAGVVEHSGGVQAAFSQQTLQQADGTTSNVIVDWASPAVVQQAGAFVRPLEFVTEQKQQQQQQQQPSDVVCISADQLWDMDLSKALRGWMWKQAAWIVSVPAGSRITGMGVAVEVVPEARIASELLVTGLLGKVELSYAEARF
jgi:hypothetical protein